MVYGYLVDEQTRCIHYQSVLDIITIKFKCCNKYYACIHCHNEANMHQVKQWKKQERDVQAILCGNCKVELTIADYFNCNNQCPNCETAFNPKCCTHFHFYFEIEDAL